MPHENSDGRVRPRFGPGVLQVRAGEAGVRGDAAQRPAALVGDGGQVPGEHQVGQLRLPVRAPGAVAPLPLQVVEPDAARMCAAPLLIVATRGAGAASRSGSRRSGQRERAEEVAAELQLEAVGRGEPSGGAAMTPALLSSMSTGVPSASRPSANSRIDARSARSTRRTSTRAVGSRGEDLVARGVALRRRCARASTTRAPAAARRSAASRPVPLFAPVTTASRPVWSGTVYTGSSSDKRPSVSYET